MERMNVGTIVLVVAGAVALAAVLVPAVTLHLMFSRPVGPAEPDVNAIAATTAVRDASDATRTVIDREMAALKARIGWADQLGISAVDVCTTFLEGTSFGGPGSWRPVECNRTTVMYAAFAGDLNQRLSQLNLATQPLAATRTQLPTVASPPDHVSAQNTLRTAGLPAGSLALLSVDVTSSPAIPYVHNYGDYLPTSPPLSPSPNERTVYFDRHPLPVTTLVRTAYNTYKYATAISFSVKYFTERSG